MSDNSGSGDEASIEDEHENQVGGDDYSSDKGMEEENIPKTPATDKKITIEQVNIQKPS